jgi:thiol-disulfide isomerase/thioredoxin
MLKIKLLLAFVGIAFFATAQPFENLTWQKALKKAAKENKMIFLDAYTSWCAPCKMMDKEVFTNEAVQKYLRQNFIPIKMNMEKGEGVFLSNLYNIHAFPTFLFADKNGNMQHLEAGGKTVEQTLEMCRIALDETQRLAAKDAFFATKGNDDTEFLKTYIEQRFALQNNSHHAAAEAYISLQNDLSSPENLDFTMKYVQNPASKAFTYLLDNKDIFVKKYGKQRVDRKIENTIYNELYNADCRVGMAGMLSLISKFYHEHSDYYAARYNTILAKNNLQQAAFLQNANAFLSNFPPEDPAEYAVIAKGIMAFPKDKKLLAAALQWIETGIKKEENYDGYYVEAVLLDFYGKTKKAKKVAQKAIDFAKKNEEDASKAIDLLETMTSK